MPMTDPIADMLTRIRNAVAVRRENVLVPFSRLKFEIAEILAREGWVAKAERIQSDDQPMIRIVLKYAPDGHSVVRHLKRISTPGRRVYVRRDDLPVVLNNIGVAVLSTSKGIMTNRDARKANVGGEVICEIY